MRIQTKVTDEIQSRHQLVRGNVKELRVVLSLADGFGKGMLTRFSTRPRSRVRKRTYSNR